MTSRHQTFGRRGFLASLGFAGAAAAGNALLPLGRLIAESRPERRFVGLYFSGGWDVLLGADARDPSRRYGSELNVGTELLPAEYRDPLPVTLGGREVLWGAPMRALLRHADVSTVFRGVNMNTVAHPTGRAYVNTFVPPAGVAARGDSLGVRMSSGARRDDLVLPSVSIGMPAYNLSYGGDLSALGLSRATEVRDLLRPQGATFDDDLAELLRQAQDESRSCVGAAYHGERPDQQLAASRERVRQLVERGLDGEFDLGAQTALQRRYGYASPNNASDPAVRAAVASQLLATNLTRSVSLVLVSGIDSHQNWGAVHPQRLEAGFDAMATLLDDLREDDPQLERTTVVAFSEFARTPRINGTQGRDHWFANSFLVFGGGLRRGVFGETVQDTLGLRAVDPVTGRASAEGVVIRPEHIGATLAAAAGIDPEPFRAPVLDAWIGGRS
ncbi:MAG: DUF1501 domain-containing protein [Myxococcales bacterium]|nr:DUF1501 domain-containing protein [Myxococcales bacterium]